MASRPGGSKKQRGSSELSRRHPGLDRRGAESPSLLGILRREDFLIVVVLALITLAVYGQVISHQFIGLDDDVYLRDNPMVAGGLTPKGIVWAFTTFYDSNWHPITWISHMLDAQLFGLNAGGHLLVNTMIHVLNSSLVFVCLKTATGSRWRSAMVAALFALHPLHVESVAWAVERKDTLSTLFGLLSLLAYVRFARAPSPIRYAMVAFWLGLGLMTKPMLVTWPFLFLLLDFWPLFRFDWRPGDGVNRFVQASFPLIREKLLLFGLAAISMIMTYLAQSHQQAAVGRVFDAPFGLRLSNAVVSYAKYLSLTFWPVHLAVYYPFSRAGVPTWQIALALVFLLVVTVAAIRAAKAHPEFIVGWFWFLGTLIPVIGLVQVGIGEAMADRYHYVPSIGLFLALVFGLASLFNNLHYRRVIPAALAMAVLLVFAGLTAVQASRWRDSETLFSHTLSVTSDNLVIEYNFGRVLGKEGKYEQAISHFLEALRIEPNFFDALADSGLYFLNQGKTEEAVSYYRRALDVKPDSANVHMQLAMALNKQDKKDNALQEFYRARDLAPGDADIRSNLGLMLTRQGKLSEASTELNEALRLNPASAEANNNLGLIFLMTGEPEKSLPYFVEALNLKPSFAVARENLERAQKQVDLRKR